MKKIKWDNIEEVRRYIGIDEMNRWSLDVKIFKELGKDIKKIRENYSTKATGVYLLINRKTGGIYVGSSMKLRERINVYSRLDGNNGKIGARMKKWLENHGVDAFSVVSGDNKPRKHYVK